MPFTFSHPAIVLPFLKVRHVGISSSALIAGSMMPDFEYFIKMNLTGRFGHSLTGMIVLDLPLGLSFLVIFHQVVKKPLIDNLPIYFSSRLQELKRFDFIAYAKKHYLWLIVCILIGIATHLLWDSFTHRDDYFNSIFPQLEEPVVITGFPDYPLYRYLQHISTVVGALLIVIVFHKIPRLTVPPSQRIDLRFWTLLTAVFVIAFSIRACFRLGYYANTLVALISAGLLGLIVASSIAKLKWNKT
jgi:hypothetical protein